MRRWLPSLVLLALLLFLALAGPGWAVVAFDAFSNATAGTGNLSWTHTPVGTPRGVMVFIIQPLIGADRVTSVTYGSLTLTERSVSPLIKSTGEDMTVYAYFAGASIPTGAQTVTVTVSAASGKQAGAITLTAGADTEEVDTTTISSDSVTNPSATLSLAGRSSFCALVFTSGIPDPADTTPLTNWTSRVEYDPGAAVGGIYTYDTIGTADVTMGWTQTADDAASIGLAVAEVAAVGGPCLRMLTGVGC